ncbi:hypothetical protein EDB89DRAFT_1913571 [Lactarius sanguifluus]|nr:hypothetical protein EDB89DRAFT_1913571 [Lactarius sanguifluus]
MYFTDVGCQQSKTGQEVSYQALPPVQCHRGSCRRHPSYWKGSFPGRTDVGVRAPPSRARDPTPSDFTIDPAIDEISRNMVQGRVEEDETGTQNKEPGASFFGSDKYSSSEDDAAMTVMTPAPCLTKRKCVKSAEPSKSAQTSGPQKARCVTAGQGISDMADSLRDMVIHMKTRKEEKTGTCKEPLTRTQKLPEDPQERAVAILEQDAEFSDQETLEIVGYFMADRDFARVYATFQSSHMCTGYLQHQLPKFRGKST